MPPSAWSVTWDCGTQGKLARFFLHSAFGSVKRKYREAREGCVLTTRHYFPSSAGLHRMFLSLARDQFLRESKLEYNHIQFYFEPDGFLENISPLSLAFVQILSTFFLFFLRQRNRLDKPFQTLAL